MSEAVTSDNFVLTIYRWVYPFGWCFWWVQGVNIYFCVIITYLSRQMWNDLLINMRHSQLAWQLYNGTT